MGWSLLSPETTSAVRDKKLYEWIPVNCPQQLRRKGVPDLVSRNFRNVKR